MRWLLLLVSLVVGGASGSSAAPARPAQRPDRAKAPDSKALAPAVPREALEGLEDHLDRAVDRVSLPRIAGLLARDAARGYRLPGYGIVFVLTPRALPGEGHDVLVHVTPRRHTGRRPRPADEAGPPEIETLERHVVILQNETEQARRAAEQDMDRIVHELRMRLLASGEAPPLEPVADDVPPAPGRVGAVPANAAPAGPAPASSAARDREDRSVDAPLPPPPPWKYWFDSGGPPDERTPQALIADVRAALVEALGSQAARVAGLRPEEYVTVAVDFEVPDPFAARPRPERTLVVRARAADIAARARAAIDSDEFRRRVEVLEY